MFNPMSMGPTPSPIPIPYTYVLTTDTSSRFYEDFKSFQAAVISVTVLGLKGSLLFSLSSRKKEIKEKSKIVFSKNSKNTRRTPKLTDIFNWQKWRYIYLNISCMCLECMYSEAFRNDQGQTPKLEIYAHGRNIVHSLCSSHASFQHLPFA